MSIMYAVVRRINRHSHECRARDNAAPDAMPHRRIIKIPYSHQSYHPSIGFRGTFFANSSQSLPNSSSRRSAIEGILILSRTKLNSDVNDMHTASRTRGDKPVDWILVGGVNGVNKSLFVVLLNVVHVWRVEIPKDDVLRVPT